jgi:predicted glycoside hydrolase/deacetylase ChbG (UPF0249 family)
MKKLVFFITLLIAFQAKSQRLVVRMDDIGGAHSMNLAVIKCYQQGIGRSTEIMPVGPWFLEAAKLCNENPGLDVGIHITLNSEWMGYKWRPVTFCPSLCDEDGFLSAGGMGASQKPVDLKEAEAEMRAQIELSLKYVKNVTHLTDHMMWTMRPGLLDIVLRLAKEYGLVYQGGRDSDAQLGLNSLGMIMVKPGEKREGAFLGALKKMEKGKTYWTIEHPALNDEEMKGIYTREGQDVGADRQDVTDTFMSPLIMEYIKDNGIEIISFGDLIREMDKR